MTFRDLWLSTKWPQMTPQIKLEFEITFVIISLRKSRSETFSFSPWITTTGLYASDWWIKLPIKFNTRIIFIIFQLFSGFFSIFSLRYIFEFFSSVERQYGTYITWSLSHMGPFEYGASFFPLAHWIFIHQLPGKDSLSFTPGNFYFADIYR